MKKVIAFILILSLSSCKSKQLNNATQQEKASGAKNPISEQNSISEPIIVSKIGDSLFKSKIIQKAKNYSKVNKNRFEFNSIPADSSINVKTVVISGNLFSKNKKHLYIQNKSANGIEYYIYLLTGETYLQVLYIKNENSNITDTLKDVNGDRYNDLLINWISSAGCCLRNYYNVYLYLPNNGGFTSEYGFMNPTFSPKELTILGIEYGHPEEIGLYKYKWNKLKIDTIEYIYHFNKNSWQFIKTKKQMYKPQFSDGVLLKKLPEEYKQIEGLDWYLNKDFH